MNGVKISIPERKSTIRTKSETLERTKKFIKSEKTRERRNRKRLVKRVSATIREASENNRFEAIIITWCEKKVVEAAVAKFSQGGYWCTFSTDGIGNTSIVVSWDDSDEELTFSNPTTPRICRTPSPRISPRDSSPKSGSRIKPTSPRDRGNRELRIASRKSLGLEELHLYKPSSPPGEENVSIPVVGYI
jgi:hypothetical protein